PWISGCGRSGGRRGTVSACWLCSTTPVCGQWRCGRGGGTPKSRRPRRSPPFPEMAPPPPAVAPRLEGGWTRFEPAPRAVAGGGGNPPRLEEFLGELPEPGRATLLLELLRVEIFHRRLGGEVPQATDYQVRFPYLDPAWLARLLLPDANGPPTLRSPDGSP